jgi:hypothetical protein
VHAPANTAERHNGTLRANAVPLDGCPIANWYQLWAQGVHDRWGVMNRTRTVTVQEENWGRSGHPRPNTRRRGLIDFKDREK